MCPLDCAIRAECTLSWVSNNEEECIEVTVLGDVPLHPMDTWHRYLMHSYHFFIIHHFFIILSFWLQFSYTDTQPTLAGLHPFLLGSTARCTFLSYFMCIYYLGSPARSRLSCSRSCPNRQSIIWRNIRQSRTSPNSARKGGTSERHHAILAALNARGVQAEMMNFQSLVGFCKAQWI